MTLCEPDFHELETLTGTMRVHRFLPSGGNQPPAVMLYSEIYQMTGPIQRLAARLAGEGFEVFVPGVYHEYEAPGTVFSYDKEGTERGNFLKFEKPLASFDSDAVALLDWITSRAEYPWHGVGTLGFCLGGHLAFRAALDKRVKAAVCFYATDIHSSTLGKGKFDDTLLRCGEIEAELLLIWGRQDPHVPYAGRRIIYDTLTGKERNFQWHEFNAAHAFARDEGPRFDPSISRIAWDMTLELFKRELFQP